MPYEPITSSLKEIGKLTNDLKSGFQVIKPIKEDDHPPKTVELSDASSEELGAFLEAKTVRFARLLSANYISSAKAFYGTMP